MRDNTIIIHPASERGSTRLDWLESRHSFSFGDYYNPEQMSFAALRVINEDWVAPGKGFAPHNHHDMEIITYVLAGQIAHQDNLGNSSIIRPGDVQRMSAGSGIRHSEVNPSATETLHLLQIWIHPINKGIAPGYEQKNFIASTKRGKLCLVGSQDGREGSVTIQQNISLYATLLAAGEAVTHMPAQGRVSWVQVARGSVQLNGHTLQAGDGAACSQSLPLTIESITTSPETAEVLLFDMLTV